jgi:CDGSH-type Zn-finger protein
MSNDKTPPKKDEQKIIISKDGPYIVCGNLPLSKEIIVTDKNGDSSEWRKGENYPGKEIYSLCRCGNSKNMPYCDSTHAEIGFDGTETASRKKYLDQADKLEGPDLFLTDVENLCVRARFCHDQKGNVWKNTECSDELESKKDAIRQAGNCPAGRLVAWEKKTGKTIEPKLEPSVGLVEDPEKKVSGPIWVKGGIPIESADGRKYEVRNRVTLCRCGKSSNKPFCDSDHIDNGFNDGDASLRKEGKKDKKLFLLKTFE